MPRPTPPHTTVSARPRRSRPDVAPAGRGDPHAVPARGGDASRRPRARDDGQAAAELVALLPLAALLIAGAWQLAVAGHASWAANGAARAAARAAAVGEDARAAARRALPGRLAGGADVRDGGDGTVEVTVRIPPVLGLPVLGHASATAHFRPQR